jgi:hypothetical protein
MPSENPPNEDFQWELVSVEVGATILSAGRLLVLDVFNGSPRDLDLLEFDYLVPGVFALSFPTLPASETLRSRYPLVRLSGESVPCPPQRHVTRLLTLRAFIPLPIDIVEGPGVTVRWSYRLKFVGLSTAKTFEGQVPIPAIDLAYNSPTPQENAGGAKGGSNKADPAD